MTTTKDLIQAAAQGDHDAFVTLIRDRTDKLHRVAGHYIREPKDAEDIVQDAIIKAFVSLHTLKQVSAFDGWLTRIVVNRALNYLNHSKRVQLTDDFKANEPTAPMPDVEQVMDLERALASLETRIRRLLYLKYKKDLTQTQISELLSMPIGTVKTQLRKGLEQLRQYMHDNDREKDFAVLSLRLKQQAENRFAIPATYDLVVEDYKDGSNEENTKGQASFLWGKPGSDDAVSATLSEDGNLLNYAISWPYAEMDTPMPEETLKLKAEHFLEDHYSGVLKDFPHTEIRMMDGLFLYTRRQTAMNLPLPESGCLIDVHAASGQVVGFKYYGKVQEPPVPKKITPTEARVAEIEKGLTLNLEYRVLDSDVYTGGDDQIHLVYAPDNGGQRFPVIEEAEQKPTKEAVHSEKVGPSLTDMQIRMPDKRSIEGWIGVDTENFELIQEKAIDADKAISVWEKRNRTSRPKHDRSWDAYWEKHAKDQIKARIDTKTGRILDFMSHCKPDKIGPLTWDRDACVKKALEYVHGLSPEMVPYLKLLGDDASDEERLEVVRFGIFVNGIPFEVEPFEVAVDRTNGKIQRFFTSRINPEQFDALDSKPALDAEQAVQTFMEQTKLVLEWEAVYGQDIPYQLVYRLIGRQYGRTPEVLEPKAGKVYESSLI